MAASFNREAIQESARRTHARHRGTTVAWYASQRDVGREFGVVHCSLDRQAAHSGGEVWADSNGYRVAVSYEYSANGVRYTGSRVGLGWRFYVRRSSADAVIAKYRANIVETLYNRAYYGVNLGDATIDITMETRGREQVEELLAAMTAGGYRYSQVV